MNSSKMIRQACHITRLCLQLYPKPLPLVGKNHTFFKYKEVSSKEMLLAGEFSDGKRSQPQAHVPKGFLAVYAGPEQRRFVIPMAYLSMPEFRVLMDRAADEFGYDQDGALRFPCEEQDFEELLSRCLKTYKSKEKKNACRRKIQTI